MKRQKIINQLKNNVISLLSLFIALAALGYTTWREEQTEKNRSIRVAAFEVLKNLGELQAIVNDSHYESNHSTRNPFLGWGTIALISDLSKIVPSPVPETIDKLVIVWKNNWEKISTDETSTDTITQHIDSSRNSVLKILVELR